MPQLDYPILGAEIARASKHFYHLLMMIKPAYTHIKCKQKCNGNKMRPNIRKHLHGYI